MATFVKLTQPIVYSKTEIDVFVNLDLVVGLMRQPTGTYLYAWGENNSMFVKESPEEILQKMKDFT